MTTTYDDGSAAQPAHCIVRGSASPRTGADGKAYETRFELRLPTTWSGRFLYQGGGGNDGIVAPAVGRNTGAFPETGLQRGFAVVTTDAGHQGGDARVRSRSDRARRSCVRRPRADGDARPGDRGALLRPRARSEVLRRLLRRRAAGHDVRPALSRRTSTASRSVRPAMRVSSGATIAAAWDTQTYLSIAPTERRRGSACSAARSATPTWRSSSRAIIAACDADDGAMDGMVQRPEACRFEPKTLQCAGEKEATCLTFAAGGRARADVPRTADVFGHERSTSGRPGILESRRPVGGSGSSARRRQAHANAANATLMAGALAHEFFTPPDPSFAITSFDFDRDPARMEAFSAVFDTYRDATLAAFRKRGGKLLIFHGTADPIFSALESIDYYQRLDAQQRRGRSRRARGLACSWCRA